MTPPKPKRGRPPKPRTDPPPREESISLIEAGARLKAARVKAKWSQADAAFETGVPQSRWSEYERGEAAPLWTRLLHFMVTLKLNPAILMPEVVYKKTSRKS